MVWLGKSAYDQVRLNSRMKFVNMNGIRVKGVSHLVYSVITIDKQFYCCTKEVIKSSRVTHFKTNFYWIYLAQFFY